MWSAACYEDCISSRLEWTPVTLTLGAKCFSGCKLLDAVENWRLFYETVACFCPHHPQAVAVDPNAGEHPISTHRNSFNIPYNKLRGVTLQSACGCSFIKFHQTEEWGHRNHTQNEQIKRGSGGGRAWRSWVWFLQCNTMNVTIYNLYFLKLTRTVLNTVHLPLVNNVILWYLLWAACEFPFKKEKYSESQTFILTTHAPTVCLSNSYVNRNIWMQSSWTRSQCAGNK